MPEFLTALSLQGCVSQGWSSCFSSHWIHHIRGWTTVASVGNGSLSSCSKDAVVFLVGSFDFCITELNLGRHSETDMLGSEMGMGHSLVSRDNFLRSSNGTWRLINIHYSVSVFVSSGSMLIGWVFYHYNVLVCLLDARPLNVTLRDAVYLCISVNFFITCFFITF